MPLSQENRLDKTYSNNNDNSYLHKKFKKMATTMPIQDPPKICEVSKKQVENVFTISSTSTLNMNGISSEFHSEIKENKLKQQKDFSRIENNVQTSYNDENLIYSNTHFEASGRTSFTNEFINKTENIDYDKDSLHYAGLGGRNICPYCKLSCAKPSVLQKHIRAHTNERPFPCVPCGFAFKTKSNLYKHRRSRTHALRAQGADLSPLINEEDLSGESESDASSSATVFSDTGFDLNTSVSFKSTETNMLPSDHLSQSDANQNESSKNKSIYKPKFRAALFRENSDDSTKIPQPIVSSSNYLTEHISKIISDNEAIIDIIETPLQKKYGKIMQLAENKQLHNEEDNKCEQKPLNLSVNCNTIDHNLTRIGSNSGSVLHDLQKHPLNPEGSIIKDILLKTKGNGFASIHNDSVEELNSLYVCPLCQIVYRSSDNLEIHRLYYCKGVQKNKLCKQESVVRDTLIKNMSRSEFKSVSPLSSTESLTLKKKPENIIIQSDDNDIAKPLTSPGPLLGKTRLVDSKISLENDIPVPNSKRKLDQAFYLYNNTEDTSKNKSENLCPRPKIRCLEADTYKSLEEMTNQIRNNSTLSLQMFGGEVKIIDQSGSTTTLRIEPSKNQLSPIFIQKELSAKQINDSEASRTVVRSGLHSGGTIVQNLQAVKEIASTPRKAITILPNVQNKNDVTRFKFPPLNVITAYNPLTLPQQTSLTNENKTSALGKLIPHIPGIPGPNTLYIENTSNKFHSVTKLKVDIKDVKEPIISNKHISSSAPFVVNDSSILNEETVKNKKNKVSQFQDLNKCEGNNKITDNNNSVSSTKSDLSKKISYKYKSSTEKMSFENISQKYSSTNSDLQRVNKSPNIKSTHDSKVDSELKDYNFENLITKAEIYNNNISNSTENIPVINQQSRTTKDESHLISVEHERSETSYFKKNIIGTTTEKRKGNFLRPTTLPLKPGTFTPKRHHGITPNSNTMPLVSPETPRPAKAYGQLYLNGNAYTYLGLKCSTKVFYCTINRPQPTYVPNQHFLSMYSNWQLLSDLNDPLGLTAARAMSLYDSRHRPQNVVVAKTRQDFILTHSSHWKKTSTNILQAVPAQNSSNLDEKSLQSNNCMSARKELAGGFESNEEYTYVRGRGRGKYVCLECGIRCKKPSMLKKHIRTHTDVRPFTCVHCCFSFKTKGNLTKHMKSKAHYKKCCELGINTNEEKYMENEECGQFSGETEDETDSDGDEGMEGETESSDTEVFRSQLPEREAAHCLLSLGDVRSNLSVAPGLITSARPSTYPYAPTQTEINIAVGANPDVKSHETKHIISSKLDSDNEPIDLSQNEIKSTNFPEISTARETSLLASLALNTAKLPKHQTQWSNGEPMLHTYLTERALFDSKIKQCQLSSSYHHQHKTTNDFDSTEEICEENTDDKSSKSYANSATTSIAGISEPFTESNVKLVFSVSQLATTIQDDVKITSSQNSKSENARFVVSEYLKQARINHIKSQEDLAQKLSENKSISGHSNNKIDMSKIELHSPEKGNIKTTSLEHETVARKVVIGCDGVTFKVNKDSNLEKMSYSPGQLMEDGRRVCDFCNKTFSKPSQLKLHLNIHYMERPFRCSACAVSFRTRGHLQKHERSGSHHNKVSMTSTFGAATSQNPRPFRCSDCNIAFRIHGHLAKHLRSKMHVMRLECLFKLPFGTFTEIERAGVSLTDIDTTDCASSLASLQSLAQKLHEKDPTKLEFKENMIVSEIQCETKDSSDDETNVNITENMCDSEVDSEQK